MAARKAYWLRASPLNIAHGMEKRARARREWASRLAMG
jgi:hypothetical protein